MYCQPEMYKLMMYGQPEMYRIACCMTRQKCTELHGGMVNQKCIELTVRNMANQKNIELHGVRTTRKI